jgi:hypothetical protein
MSPCACPARLPRSRHLDTCPQRGASKGPRKLEGARLACANESKARRLTPAKSIVTELHALDAHVRANPGQGAGVAARIREAFPEVDF